MATASEQRLAAAPGLGMDALSKLQASCVVVVGAGALGGGLLAHLATLGTRLVIVDFDSVSPENLANQGFAAAAVGLPKAEERARMLRALNPDCTVLALTCAVEELGSGLFAGADLLVSAVDSKTVRFRLNDLAIRLGLPLLDAAVDGSGHFTAGTVSYYDSRRADSPCYICTYDAKGYADALAAETHVGCPSWRAAGLPLTRPTLQSSAFGAVVSGYQAMLAVRALTGEADELIGRRLLVSAGAKITTRTVRVDRNPSCLHDHTPIAPLHAIPEPNLHGAIAVAERLLGGGLERIGLYDRRLVAGLICAGCGQRREILKVTTAVGDADLVCPGCGRQPMAPATIADSFTVADLSPFGACSWAELGVPGADIVVAEAGGKRAHLLVAGDTLDMASQAAAAVER